ncbi:hypothetical protein [Alteriqipengyuania sp. 357]
MRASIGRRGFLAGVGAMALLPGALRAGTIAGEFILSRALCRSLPDSLYVEATRQWRISFAPAGNGTTLVNGTQIAVEVAAPPALAALADLERRRVESGFLPLRLDAEGSILPADPGSAAPALPETAVTAALDYAHERTAGVAPEAASRQFIRDISDRGHDWLTLLPRDLFFPVPRDSSASRAIAVPDGTEGTVTMREKTEADPATGLMVSFLREAETTTGEITRKGRDRWAIADAVP